MSSILFLIKIIISFLPFILFTFINKKVNSDKEVRHRQYIMPVVAVAYSIVLLILLPFLDEIIQFLISKVAYLFKIIHLEFIGDFIQNIYSSWGIFVSLVLFNTLAMIVYVTIKKIVVAIFSRKEVNRDTTIGNIVSIFYNYDSLEKRWYIKDNFGQARFFIKSAYYGCVIASSVAVLISCTLCKYSLISSPFYPVFAIIIIGELAFYIDGLRADEKKSDISVKTDKSKRIAMYPLLRKPLKVLFGDKLAADGTTINNEKSNGGAIEDILVDLEKKNDHVGENYATFIRRKMTCGFKPNVDFVRTGYDLAMGRSLLFNTPFYDKLNPYVFYAMNRTLMKGGKALIILGRHGIENDLYNWCRNGMKEISNIHDLWKIKYLSKEKVNNEILSDIGIISCSGVHDLDIQKNNIEFLRKVSFVVIIEPSRLVTTAQIGLNLLIKNCGSEKDITFVSVDRNCDGLVDTLSHILMTNITEVAATEYPHGMSSYMYWVADDEHLQHRILPGVSRCLGMGTELSMVALKNQVGKAVWYGGDAFPVIDAHWIAKQYYYDLLEYAKLPNNQECFDNSFIASFNMCNEKVRDYSFVVVEDDRNNLFEVRRIFATMAEKQGFVNVISSEYMLREYMSSNPELFTTDAKATPYIAADYARTKRNMILTLCLRLCVGTMTQEELNRQILILNIDTKEPIIEIWKEICIIFSENRNAISSVDENQILLIKDKNGSLIKFERDKTIICKRMYSMESGRFEKMYTIADKKFANVILEDLQNATYIAEQDTKDVYIGSELKGHVYQKYLPGQFFTLNGKYYEMVSVTFDNRIMVRRASEHINGRISYRQIRNYTIHRIEDTDVMGTCKICNNIKIQYQFADFSVKTPGYWKMKKYNDFKNGVLIEINGVPDRDYHHKQILKLDFSAFSDAFSDTIRNTLTVLMNEVFVTLFAENHHFISAVTPGNYDIPKTYGLEIGDGANEKCIYIIEDSQLDIGLLVTVERNLNRILQIISDYLSWNDDKILESIKLSEKSAQDEAEKAAEEQTAELDEAAESDKDGSSKKKSFIKRVIDWFKGVFEKRKVKKEQKKKLKEEEKEKAEAKIVEDEKNIETKDNEEREDGVKDIEDTADEMEGIAEAVEDTKENDIEEETEEKRNLEENEIADKVENDQNTDEERNEEIGEEKDDALNDEVTLDDESDAHEKEVSDNE